MYSQNKDVFDEVLKKFGLNWVTSSAKMYVVSDKNGKYENAEKKILTGMYSSKDGVHKILMIYLGKDKPAMMIYKTSGSGGMFLIELMSLCHKVGCDVEDENDMYVESILSKISRREDIDIGIKDKKKDKDKKESMSAGVTLFDFVSEDDDKIDKYTNEILEEFIKDYAWLYDLRGIDINVVRKFKKRDIRKSVAWALEHKFLT